MVHKIKNIWHLVDIKVNGRSINFEMDTWANVAIISKKTQHLFHMMKLIATNLKFKTYLNETLHILEMLNAKYFV